MEYAVIFLPPRGRTGIVTFKPLATVAFMLLFLAGCTSTLTPTEPPIPTRTVNSLNTLPITDTPFSTYTPTPKPLLVTPSVSTSATPELLRCPEWSESAIPPIPIQFLYTSGQEVQLWDGANGTNQLIPLPAEAAYPVIAPDGRHIAYLEKDAAYSTPEHRAAEIPLWLYDRQTGQSRQLAVFSTDALHQRFPEAPYIYVNIEWLPDSARLLAQLNPYPWGVGILQHTGPLYLMDATHATQTLLLDGGEYELFNLRPDGGQVAALDTAALAPDGSFDFEQYQQGNLHLIDTTTGKITRRLPLKLALDPWAFMPPIYAPDGTHLVVNLEGGLGVVDTQTGVVQIAPLDNTCLAENDCWWTDYVPIFWLPDSRSFYTLQSVNDYFDERAETTLSQVFLEGGMRIESLAVTHANTISFSPDRRIITYWNQPDIEEIEQDQKRMNWVTFYLMDVQQLEARLYQSAYLHRLSAWNPDNVRFLYFYSAGGGANPERDRLGLGSICQPPQEIPLPRFLGVNETQWLDASRFLVWTYATEHGTSASEPGLYLYDLADLGGYTFLAPVTYLSEQPYADQRQVVVLPNR